MVKRLPSRERSQERSPSPHRRRINHDRHHSHSRSKWQRSSSWSREYSRHKYQKHPRGKKSKRCHDHLVRDYKIDEIFNWVKNLQETRWSSRDWSRPKYSSVSGRYGSKRRDSSRSSHSRRSKDSHDISFDSNSEKRLLVVLNTEGNSKEDQTKNYNSGSIQKNGTSEVVPLTARLNWVGSQGVPKPVIGPPISEEISPFLDSFLSKPEFIKTMKVCEKYRWPENMHHLTIPELPKVKLMLFQSLGQRNSIFFLLFRLAGKCWQKITMDQAKAILVAPNWPTQHWYATF